MTEHGPKKVVAADGHEYHKSATANATTAPTNEATIANAEKTKGLSSEEAEFVTIVDYEWNLPSGFKFEVFSKEYGYTDDEVKTFVSKPEIVQALAERGILIKRVLGNDVQEASKVAKLTPLQLIAANVLMDLTDTRSNKKKLADLGVTPYQYNNWLNQAEFKHYLQQRAEGLLGNVQHEAMVALIDQVMSGNLKAIEYYHEITGRYTRAAASNQGGGSQAEMQNLIIRVVEIIQDEVSDMNEALRIADRLKGLATGMQVAGVLPAPEIITPEVAEGREITPKVKELMDQGLGYDS